PRTPAHRARASPHPPLAPLRGREADDARRMVELFEPPQNLVLFRGQPLGREGRVAHVDGIGPDVVEPAGDFDRALGAQIATIEMERPRPGGDRVDQRTFGQVALTKNEINKTHDWTSCFRQRTVTFPSRAKSAASG